MPLPRGLRKAEREAFADARSNRRATVASSTVTRMPTTGDPEIMTQDAATDASAKARLADTPRKITLRLTGSIGAEFFDLLEAQAATKPGDPARASGQAALDACIYRRRGGRDTYTIQVNVSTWPGIQSALDWIAARGTFAERGKFDGILAAVARRWLDKCTDAGWKNPQV